MDELFPNKTHKRCYYDLLEGKYPELSPSSNVTLAKESIETMENIPPFLTTTTAKAVDVRLDEVYKNGDIQAVLVKETDLENIVKCSLLIGGRSIVELDKDTIDEFCDRHVMENGDIFVNLFDKFIERIPIQTCMYHRVCARFEYEKYDVRVSSVKSLVFKYDNYDDVYANEIGYSPDAYQEVTTLVYRGWTPDISLIPSPTNCQNTISFLEKCDDIRNFSRNIDE